MSVANFHVSDLEQKYNNSVNTTQPNDRAVLEIDNAPPVGTLDRAADKVGGPGLKGNAYSQSRQMDFLYGQVSTFKALRGKQMGMHVTEIKADTFTAKTLQGSLVASGAIAADSYLATIDVADIMDLPLTAPKGVIRYLSTPVKKFLELLRKYAPVIYNKTITVLQTITVAPNKPDEDDPIDRPKMSNGSRRGWWHRRANRMMKEKLRRRTKMRYWRTYR